MDGWANLFGPAVFLAFLAYVVVAYFLRKRPARKAAVDRPNLPYKVFSTAFDRVLHARDVPTALAGAGLQRTPPSGLEFADPDRRYANALDAYERAKTSDGARALADALQRSGRGMCVSLLVDQSGSMVNRMPGLAGQLRAVSEVFDDTGVELSILGFTTFGWRGGMVREAWIKNGRPAYPGRLCALMHVIYQDFGSPLADDAWRTMLDPCCLFENIDGEALAWAASRIAARPQSHKLLIVVSDGAPVDDSTLLENGPGFLVRHLGHVIADYDAGQDITLAAVGIDHRVSEYYRRSVMMESEGDLQSCLAELTVAPGCSSEVGVG
ncbi:MAG: hypothetical protein KGN34_06305 [Sphingomonadales bacterium]|nr:hypothetical protein [Sphingomonadales bacterium]